MASLWGSHGRRPCTDDGAKQAIRTCPLEEEGHLGRLSAYRKNRVKGEAASLTLDAEAFRASSRLVFFLFRG